MTRIALFIATAAGAGYAPVAPGTAGSAVGILVYFGTRHWAPAAQVALLVAISIIGIWASTVAARHFKRDDPGHVVIDEVAGQLLTILLLGAGPVTAVIGFVVFRALDIVKPWPARQLESLHGGTGIMADDLMAGAYGWLLMFALGTVLPAEW